MGRIKHNIAGPLGSGASGVARIRNANMLNGIGRVPDGAWVVLRRVIFPGNCGIIQTVSQSRVVVTGVRVLRFVSRGEVNQIYDFVGGGDAASGDSRDGNTEGVLSRIKR